MPPPRGPGHNRGSAAVTDSPGTGAAGPKPRDPRVDRPIAYDAIAAWAKKMRTEHGLTKDEAASLKDRALTRLSDLMKPIEGNLGASDYYRLVEQATRELGAERVGYRPGEENPWLGRKGWEQEPALPVLRKDDGKAEEPGYIVANELVADRHLRPFRTTAGEPRVAFPTARGVEVRDPSSPEFADAVGYRFYTLAGRKVPDGDLRVAARAFTQRALARELPTERVVDLAIRVAPDGDGGSFLDLADRDHRCVRNTPGGWRIEKIAYPVFDSPSHLAPLPEPVPPPDSETAWRWYERLFRFVSLPERSDDGGDPRLLAAAIHVQFLVAPSSPKPIVALIAEEGAGKTTAAERLQELVDPSKVRSLGAPESARELGDLAFNRATLNLDNLSHIPEWLSDNLARLCTGAGLAKRLLYSNRGEVIARRVPLIIFNGITPTPRYADLIRRVAFLEAEPPKVRLALGELERGWQTAHPEILGGILRLACDTLRVLGESPSPGGPPVDSMADFVRIGRALAVALGRPASDFDRAWAHNLERQGAAAAENPWVGVLYEQLENQETPISSAELAVRISAAHKETWPRGVTAQQVGNELRRFKATLERLGLRFGRRMLHGTPQYFRKDSETGSPSSPSGSLLESFSDGEPQGEPRVNLVREFTLPRGEPNVEVHSGPPTRFSDGRGEPCELGEPPLKVSGSGSESPADPGDLFAGAQTRADRARADRERGGEA